MFSATRAHPPPLSKSDLACPTFSAVWPHTSPFDRLEPHLPQPACHRPSPSHCLMPIWVSFWLLVLRSCHSRGRIKAVEQAWTGMREQARKAQGKGKAGGADGWALEEVADWVIETMVTSTSFSALRLADVKDSPHQQTHWLYPLPQLPTPRSCQSSRSFSSNHHLRPAQLRPIPP